MSGECYSKRDQTVEKVPSKESVANKGMNGDGVVPKNDVNFNQLLEYENMVSSAESKCSQLKGQLEKIKQLYANQAEIVKQAMDVDRPKAKSKSAGKIETCSLSPVHNKDSNPKPKAKMMRQNSHCIGTDNTGAALTTINNILAGITKSIQIPEFFDQIKDLRGKTHTDQVVKRGVEDVKINNRTEVEVNRSKLKFKQKRSNPRVASKTSSTVMKKMKKAIKLPDKRARTSDGQIKKSGELPVIDARSKKILKRPRVAPRIQINRRLPPTSANNDLVEIYHNAAVKESKSSDINVNKKQPRPPSDAKKVDSSGSIVPPLEIEIDEASKANHQRSMMSALSRNYEMPTISSRMKQVAKFYMNSFNIRSIPFCPATSTGPSHNIGINIQQVMNMVKTKQPVQQLSPTLAYNIGLAAGKWNNTNPLSFLVSSLTSRICNPPCPLSRSTINYHHLQEVAKTIPQDIIEEVDENEEANSPETQSVIITGPSGDIKIHNLKKPVWTMDALDDKKCTCAPPKGVEFQQIINKFNGSVSKSRVTKSPSQIQKIPPKKDHILNTATECTPLQNKEKKLKEVLGKLHDEFEQMTITYDELVKQSEEGNATEEITKQLEDLDKDLNSKEEEIVMVMTLYKEVLALKQQVKTLKERTISKENVSIISIPVSKTNNVCGGNSTANGLLNKLLRQVQHYQTHYKKN